MGEQLQGRVILVSGGTGGIGRGVARTMAEAGAQVVVHGRSAQTSEAAVAELKTAYPQGDYQTAHADLSDVEAVGAMFEDLKARFGKLDGLVDCTQEKVGGVRGYFEEIDPKAFGPLVLSTFVPLFNLCHHALPLLKLAGGGAIVTVATDAGRIVQPRQTMIGTVKAGVMMFSRSLALEVSQYGVRVNCISPSYVKDTPIYDWVVAEGPTSRAHTAMKRAKLGLPGPGDLGALARFLCSDDAAYLTGQVISVNGGLSSAA
ncbi:MAG: hypothetical protein JWO33_2598 [Caulobacteraceae bacterium]|nr:hypothetical protein [Caulobacteraceae bacterium]